MRDEPGFGPVFDHGLASGAHIFSSKEQVLETGEQDHGGCLALTWAPEYWQFTGLDEHLCRPGLARCSRDEAAGMKLLNHLVHGRRRYAEVPLHFDLGRRPAVNFGVRVDEGQILALLLREILVTHIGCRPDFIAGSTRRANLMIQRSGHLTGGLHEGVVYRKSR